MDHYNNIRNRKLHEHTRTHHKLQRHKLKFTEFVVNFGISICKKLLGMTYRQRGIHQHWSFHNVRKIFSGHCPLASER